MKPSRILIPLLLLVASAVRLLAQSADTSARVQPSPEPPVTPGILIPIFEDRLFMLLVGLILAGGMALLLNKKRKKADTEALRDGITK